MTFPIFLVFGCFRIEILDDDLLEGVEVVEVTISSDEVFIGDGTLSISISDSDDLEGML